MGHSLTGWKSKGHINMHILYMIYNCTLTKKNVYIFDFLKIEKKNSVKYNESIVI